MKQCGLLLPGSFLLAQSQLKPHSDHTHRLVSPALPADAKFCLRFYFSLKGGSTESKTLKKVTLNLTGAPFHRRFQADGKRSDGAPAAQRRPREDLEPGGEIPRDLDGHRGHLPDVQAVPGESESQGQDRKWAWTVKKHKDMEKTA